VKISNLVKQYSKKGPKAVDDISMQFYEGEIFALLGHNGSGKSSTIHMLTGLMKPTEGTAKIAGLDLLKDLPFIRQLIGMCLRRGW
jgi:ABC-2 type transport system ATP-binding protein